MNLRKEDFRKGKVSRHPFQYMIQFLKAALLGTVVLGTLFGINQIDLADYFPIKTVKVFGVNRVDREEIQELIMPLVNRGFFAINVDYIRDRLLQMPWVSTIFVRRTWPDQIVITVVEKKPIAHWNDKSLLSEGGELFAPKQETYPENLPKFVGPEGQQLMMLDYFYQINRLLLPLRAKIDYLELTPYLTWKLTLDNGINLQIGHKDILTRLDHFVRVYPKIVGTRAADVDYIDLRYPNGLAIRWKPVIKT